MCGEERARDAGGVQADVDEDEVRVLADSSSSLNIDAQTFLTLHCDREGSDLKNLRGDARRMRLSPLKTGHYSPRSRLPKALEVKELQAKRPAV